MKWIEAVADAVQVPETAGPLNKLCVSLQDTESLIEEGHQLFFGLSDDGKKYLLKHRLSVVCRLSTGKVSVKNCKGGSNHSIGGTILRWVAFCYNGLRNDQANTKYWMKRADAMLNVKNSSRETRDSLEELLEEAKDNLVVAPEEEVLARLVDALKDDSLPEESNAVASLEKPTFIHNLFMNADVDEDSSDTEHINSPKVDITNDPEAEGVRKSIEDASSTSVRTRGRTQRSLMGFVESNSRNNIVVPE